MEDDLSQMRCLRIFWSMGYVHVLACAVVWSDCMKSLLTWGLVILLLNSAHFIIETYQKPFFG